MILQLSAPYTDPIPSNCPPLEQLNYIYVGAIWQINYETVLNHIGSTSWKPLYAPARGMHVMMINDDDDDIEHK